MHTEELHFAHSSDSPGNSQLPPPYVPGPQILPVSAAGSTVAPISMKRKSSTPASADLVQRKIRIKPLIIHSVCPPLIHAEPSNFMWVVQSLTGCALTRLRCEEFLSRGSVASPSCTTSGAASSSCTSTSCRSTDDQKVEGSFSLLPECAYRGARHGLSQYAGEYTSGFPARCSEKMGAKKGDDHEVSSSAVLMAASYEGDQETSSSDIATTRDDEAGKLLHAACSSDANKELQETSSSACTSSENAGSGSGSGSGSAQLERDLELILDGKACSSDDDDHIFVFDTSHFSVPPYQDLNSTVDTYLEHLLVSYDSAYPCKYSSSATILADACDTFLLKDIV